MRDGIFGLQQSACFFLAAYFVCYKKEVTSLPRKAAFFLSHETIDLLKPCYIFSYMLQVAIISETLQFAPNRSPTRFIVRCRYPEDELV